jgi:hypothetical protein
MDAPTLRFFPHQKEDAAIDTRGGTLILPILSTANVPQLAVDLLVSYGSESEKEGGDALFRRLGIVESSLLPPLAGPDPLRFSAAAGVSTALEGE